MDYVAEKIDEPSFTHRMRGPQWLLAPAAIALIADQTTKDLAVRALIDGVEHWGPIHFRLVANRGVLMGLPLPPVLAIAAVAAIGIVAVRRLRSVSALGAMAFGLIVGGAIGNGVDRLVARRLFPAGAVVDWLGLGGMTFNLADVAIVAGAALLALTDRASAPSRSGG